jgi:NAD(P)-dependent dehydrogenase (short-subunit alcohol dehydrogenase family)
VCNIKSRNCLITGAAGGIGLILAETFSKAGFTVIATDIAPKPPNLICHHYIEADLCRVASEQKYAEDIFTKIHQCLDDTGLIALINNAAVQVIEGTENLSRDSWYQTLGINLLAPFFLAQEFLSELEAVNGCIINISSVHAHQTKRKFVSYATSKAALSGLTRAMAVDLAGRIRVVAIEPAAIETDMLKAGFFNNPEGYEQLNKLHPIGRIGHPSEVARLALLIVDGGVNFLNGVCISMDGGVGAVLVDPDIKNIERSSIKKK